MKAEYGKLDVSKRYSLVEVEYLGEGMYWRCENCDNIINNVAFVKDDEGNVYRIGLDCMMALTNMEPNEKKQAKKELNREKKFIKFLKMDCKAIVVRGEVCYLYKFVADKFDTFNAAWRARREYLENILKRFKIENIKMIYDDQYCKKEA